MGTPIHLVQTGPFAFEAKTEAWSVRIDLDELWGGTETGPSPTQLLAISLAACKLITAQVWARNRKIELKNLSADVGYEMVEGPTRVGTFDVALQNLLAQVPEDLHPRLEKALHACWVATTLEHPPEIKTTLE